MDRPPTPVVTGNVEYANGGPSSDSSGGHRVEVRDGSVIRNAGLTEAISSSAADLLREPLLVVANNEPTPESLLLVTSLAVEGAPNPEGESVVEGLYASNSTDDSPQQEEEVGVAAEVTGQREPNGVDESVVAPNSSSSRSSRDDFRQEDPPVPVEVAGEGETNPGGAAGVVVVGLNAPNRTDDLQQEAAVPVEVAGQGERNPGGESVVVGLPALNNSTNGFQQEFAVPVEVPDDQKMSSEEAAKQLESRSLLEEQNSNEGDSIVCPICMEPWTNSGDHRICSLACGHLFGNSCIKRWLRQAGRKSSRCPHCNKRAKWEDLRTLYVPRTLAVVDGEAQQLVLEVRALKDENLRLKVENEKLLEEVRQNKGKNGQVQAPAVKSLVNNSARNDLISVHEPTNVISGSEPVQYLRNRVTFSAESSLFGPHSGRAFDSRSHLAGFSGRLDHQLREGGSIEAGPNSSSSRAGRFQLQSTVCVHGGKVFDMDAERLTVIFSNKIGGSGSGFGLSKMSLLSGTEIERIDLPSGFGAIRDIRFSPSGIGGTGKCALVASTGKKLSLISLESNNIVLTYSVQSPPWSCAWDPYVPNLLYSGLQNGALLLVDLRQTSSPVAMLNGPSMRPIHTVQVVPGQSPMQQANMGSHPFGGREILSASNSGISLWHLDSSFAGSDIARPQCVFSDKEILCISLVYECLINSAVASFRRSPSAHTEPSSSLNPRPSPGQNSSQPLDGPSNRTPSAAAIGCEEPSHWIFSGGQKSSWSQLSETIGTAEFRLPWEKIGEMVGNKSQSLMPRTAIIPQSKSEPRSKSLFACGDEGTNSLWLWDMTSRRLTDTLVPHLSPVLDVRNVQIQGKDMLGCVSEGTLQIYKRLPLSE